MKVLTFVIPAYNSEQYLDKCIPSMLAPEILDKLEIIVVNDGSTDRTAAVAEKYCAQYPETVRLISQENKGHGGALNTGCAAVKGKYLKVIDADDWVQTQNLPKFVKLLEHSENDVVLTHYHTIDISTGEIKNWKSYPSEYGCGYTFEEIMTDWRNFNRSFTLHGITYRTAFFHEFGSPLSEHVFYEDYEYATFPCCHAKSVIPFDLFLYEYRIGDVNQSVSSANQLKRIGHTETVLQSMTDKYNSLPESAGKRYAAMKIQELQMSYLTTALLINPDRKAGRKLAAKQMNACRANTPQIYNMMKRKYQTFLLMNRLYISQSLWKRIIDSRCYRILKKKHSFGE